MRAFLCCENELLDHQEQAHLELALRGDAVQAVLVEAEALAGGQLVVLALVADDGLAFQRGEDGVAGGAVGGQAGALVKGHQHELHVGGADEVEVCDAVLFVRDQVFQLGGIAGFQDVVHGRCLLFQNDFGVDHAAVGGAGAAQGPGRDGQKLPGMQGHFAPFCTQHEPAAALAAQVQGGAVVALGSDGRPAPHGKPCDGDTAAQLGRAGYRHGVPDGADLPQCEEGRSHGFVLLEWVSTLSIPVPASKVCGYNNVKIKKFISLP